MRCGQLQHMPVTIRALARPAVADAARRRRCRRSRDGSAGSDRMRKLGLRSTGTLPHAPRNPGSADEDVSGPSSARRGAGSIRVEEAVRKHRVRLSADRSRRMSNRRCAAASPTRIGCPPESDDRSEGGQRETKSAIKNSPAAGPRIKANSD